MRFIVYGAGGVGSTLGAQLFRTGHDAVLVGNPKHVDKIRESGLRFIAPEADGTPATFVLDIPAYKEAKELIPFREDDVVLLTAKSQHTLLCLGQLKNAGAPRTLPIFCCQNGIWNEPLATRVFDRVYGIVLRGGGLFLLEYGEVRTVLAGPEGSYIYMEVGSYPRGADDLAHKVSAVFKQAGFASRINEEVMKAKAAKCLNAILHCLVAITGGKGDHEPFVAGLRDEAKRVWQAAGIEWEELDSFTRRVNRTGMRVIPEMRKGYEHIQTSAQASLIRGTGNIEAEPVNGDVVALGRLLGINAPYNELVWRVSEEMAKKGEAPGKYTAEELMRLVHERETSGTTNP